ncbi:MAG: hypothetical protein ABIQ89_04580 [Candidatus Saccharimonadales bacterium]
MNTFTLKQSTSKLVLAVTALTLMSVAAFGLVRPTKASAAYATVTNINGYGVQVCKLSGPYGYVLRTVATKPANADGMLNVNTSAPSPGDPNVPKAHTSSNQWYWGVVTTTDTYAGNDSWSFTTTLTSGGNVYRYGWVLMAYVPWC